MGVPMQSSLVQVPCKSGSPHGVFGCVQVLAAAEDFDACPTAGCAISTSIEAATAIPATNPPTRNPITTLLFDSPNAPMLLHAGGRVQAAMSYEQRNGASGA